MDYETLSTLLLQGMGKGLISDGFGKPQTLHYKNRLLGYTAYPISDVYIGILIRDITESARLESIAEAVNAMENITYIFSGLRHELGNPINSIKMTLSVLKKNLDRYSQTTVREYVDRTLAEISRVEYLLKSLKSFSMFENPIIQNVNLFEFMDLFQSLVADDLEKNGIKINITLSPEAKWARADPRALQQVMLNLIANAADALESRDNPQIVISTVKKNGLLWIDVEDNGIGIPNEDQKNLFKPFYTTKPHGTGLGLAITRKMLTKMHSRIGIMSRKDVGTTVTISMPEGRGEDE
jgi:signal transduction histidine kinase